MSDDTLILNGRAHPFPGTSLSVLLAELEITPDARGVAVAVNGEIVPRERWPEAELRPGDEVDVVGAVQGG